MSQHDRTSMIEPGLFVSSRNAQLLARIVLARALLSGAGLGCAWELYSAVHRCSDPTSQEFNEDGRKFSLFDYLASATSLIASIQHKGFVGSPDSPVRVNEAGIVLDGAHRLAAAICLGINAVPAIMSHDAGEGGLPLTRLSKLGLSAVHQETLEREVLLSQNAPLSAMVFFGFGKEESTRLMKSSEFGDSLVITSKTFNLTENGKSRLIDYCYGSNPWFNPEISVQLGVERFLGQKDVATVIFFQVESSDLIDLKTELRRQFKGFERRIHSSDNRRDVLRLLTFSTRSGCHWANNSPAGSESKFLSERGGKLHDRTYDGLDGGVFVSGSTVLELYGETTARDRDILHSGSPLGDSSPIENSHNHHLTSLGVSVGDLLVCSENSFFLEGDRILSPSGAIRIYSKFVGNESSARKLSLATAILTDSPSEADFKTKGLLTLRLRIHLSRLYEALIAALPERYRRGARSFARKVGRVVFRER